jgi:hypothetical protein
MRDRWGRVAGVLGLLAVLGALVVPLVGGAARPGYSHSSQFISELGERGTSDGGWVSWAGFVPVGLVVIGFGVAAALALRGHPRLALGAVIVGVGVGGAYVVSAFARCAAGCPTDGDTAQTIHNLLGGTLEYVGAAVGLLVFGLAARKLEGWRFEARLSLVAVPVIVVIGSFLESESVADQRGTLQRVLELLIFGWIAVVGGRLAAAEPGAV